MTTLQSYELCGLPGQLAKLKQGIYPRPVVYRNVLTEGHPSRSFLNNRLPYLIIKFDGKIVKIIDDLNNIDILQKTLDEKRLS